MRFATVPFRAERPRFLKTSKLCFFSNCWLFFGKLWEARSRLYRSRILQVHTKYSFESSWRDLQDWHAFAPLRTQTFNVFALVYIFVSDFSKFDANLKISPKLDQNHTFFAKMFIEFRRNCGDSWIIAGSQFISRNLWIFSSKFDLILENWQGNSFWKGRQAGRPKNDSPPRRLWIGAHKQPRRSRASLSLPTWSHISANLRLSMTVFILSPS